MPVTQDDLENVQSVTVVGNDHVLVNEGRAVVKADVAKVNVAKADGEKVNVVKADADAEKVNVESDGVVVGGTVDVVVKGVIEGLVRAGRDAEVVGVRVAKLDPDQEVAKGAEVVAIATNVLAAGAVVVGGKGTN